MSYHNKTFLGPLPLVGVQSLPSRASSGVCVDALSSLYIMPQEWTQAKNFFHARSFRFRRRPTGQSCFPHFLVAVTEWGHSCVNHMTCQIQQKDLVQIPTLGNLAIQVEPISPWEGHFRRTKLTTICCHTSWKRYHSTLWNIMYDKAKT